MQRVLLRGIGYIKGRTMDQTIGVSPDANSLVLSLILLQLTLPLLLYLPCLLLVGGELRGGGLVVRIESSIDLLRVDIGVEKGLLLFG